MKHELIERKPDGSRVKVTVTIISDWHKDTLYSISVETCEKGKRTWNPTVDGNDYRYRALSMDDRKKFCEQKDIEAALKVLINKAMLQAWEKMAPVLYEETDQ